MKTKLQSRSSDSNLAKLMRIAIEGPAIEIPDVFKGKNRCIMMLYSTDKV